MVKDGKEVNGGVGIIKLLQFALDQGEVEGVDVQSSSVPVSNTTSTFKAVMEGNTHTW
jgi:hypothetical protein